MKQTLWVVDPIPYLGGSKVASADMLKEVESSGCHVRIFSRNTGFWRNSGFDCCQLFHFKVLERSESGLMYFFKHFIIAVQVFLRLIFLKKSGKLMGISGPGVDISVYWLSAMFNLDVVQVIHGPVSNSKTNTRNLFAAKVIVCLESESQRVRSLLTGDGAAFKGSIYTFVNGIHPSRWPLKTRSNFSTPHFFWAASLLKWKRVGVFIDAFSRLDSQTNRATLCYIHPKSTCLKISDVPPDKPNLALYEQPEHLDALRASANIFVSTSINEPFGLSILEALAAGLCVVIPADGAYWDRVLTGQVNCLKYSPDQKMPLEDVFNWIQNNMKIVSEISVHGLAFSGDYRSKIQFKHIVRAILDD